MSAVPVPFRHGPREFVPAALLAPQHPDAFVCGMPGSTVEVLVGLSDLPRVRSRYSAAAARQGVAVRTSYSKEAQTLTVTLL
jgi:hypothetical protein